MSTENEKAGATIIHLFFNFGNGPCIVNRVCMCANKEIIRIYFFHKCWEQIFFFTIIFVRLNTYAETDKYLFYFSSYIVVSSNIGAILQNNIGDKLTAFL